MDTSIVITFIVICIVAVFIPATKAAQKATSPYHGIEKEIPTIKTAAARNNCTGKLFSILLAIRKTENGRPGREFGIMNDAAYNLDMQAGWAAATVVKNFERWKAKIEYEKTVESILSFIDFLADKYCPQIDDPQGNANWKKNVRYWFVKFEAEK